MSSTTSTASPPSHGKHDPHAHVHFPQEDIARKEGKEHNKALDVLNVHAPDHSLKSHVHIAQEDIARKEGKVHNKELDKLNGVKPQNVSLASAHVHFTEEDTKRKEGKEHNKALDKLNVHAPPDHDDVNSLKVKVSKEDFMTHLKMLFAVSVLFFGGTYYSSTLTPTTDMKPNMQQSLNKVLNTLEQMAFAKIPPPIPKSWIESPNRSEEWNCDVLLAQSSIPNSMFGVFTKKDLKQGDEIFASGSHAVSFLLDGVDVPLSLPLFKHHSVYANVKVDESLAIVATDTIQAGSELFINLNDDSLNPKYRELYQTILYPNDPTSQDYLEADALVKDLFDVLPTRPDRKVGRRTGRQAAVMKRIPSVDAGPLLNVYREHIQKYNPKLASLIPVDMNEARNMMEATSEKFISNVRSLDWLQNHSLCLDGLRAEKSTFAVDSMGAFATTSVSAGDVITTIPLIATMEDDLFPNCFKLNDTTVRLCPLSDAALVQTAVEGCTEEEECPINVANAMYQFSSLNQFNKERFNLLKGIDSLKNSVTGLTMDIIATRDIKEGDEIFANRMDSL